MVKMTRTVPRLTVLYGASCSGLHGSWFFNSVQAGAADELRPSYHLLWKFAGSATSARPSGSISVPPTKKTTVKLTISNGKITLSGVRKPNPRVTATGTLIVKITGTTSSPSLTFIEKGLIQAEHALGLVSPFVAGGHPLVLPVKHVKTLPGC